MRRIPVIGDRPADLPKLSALQLVTNLGPALALHAVSFGTVLWALVGVGWLTAASPVGSAHAVWVDTASWAVGFVVVVGPAGLGVLEVPAREIRARRGRYDDGGPNARDGRRP